MATDANATYSIQNLEHKNPNYTMIQAFEWYVPGAGIHWNTLKDRVPELSRMGITAMWLPPLNKAFGSESAGYDVYDLWDLGEFDQKGIRRTKYGTKEELINLIKFANENGVVSYVDAVLNHKMGGDRPEIFKVTEVEPSNRLRDKGGLFELQGWTAFDFPGRGGKYSDFKWNFNHFTGLDQSSNNGPRIFRIEGNGKYWAHDVDKENGNYDYLMGFDIDHHHPEVRNDLFNWGKWIIDEVGAAGFRFDAIKHIDETFISDFIKYVRDKSGKPAMFAVGEYWKDNLGDLDGYLNKFGTQFSIFDTPLHYNFKEAGEKGNGFDMRGIFDDTLVKIRPVDAVTFVDNHDTQPGQQLESWVSPWFKPIAYAIILLRSDGYPCVFYGDLYGCGGDRPQQPMTQLADFIRARKLFAYGETRNAWDHPNCIGWVRAGDETHDGCAVVACNGDEGSKWLNAGKEHVGEKWTDVLGWHQGEVTINADGWGEFHCPARSVSIWTKTNARGREEFNKPITRSVRFKAKL